MKLFNQIITAFKQQLPFVVYKKPNQSVLKALFQKDAANYNTNNYSEAGFVFAPFDNSDNNLFIPKAQANYFEETINLSTNLTENNFNTKTNLNQKQAHINLVNKGIDAIKNHVFKKVVLSREELIKLTSFDITSTLAKLLHSYPTAMVYIWFHPKSGLWLGATPETLVKINSNNFETMALAGTQSYTGQENVIWGTKEKEEQQLVTDYILSELKPISSTIKAATTNTVKAGNLLHLHTKITGTHNNNLKELIKALHPTPAVCGMPKEKSKAFILANENYNREYYTGFLGELNIKNESHLFVNLRCAKIEDKQAILYVGGGIVADSNAKNEWQETVAKTGTIKRVL